MLADYDIRKQFLMKLEKKNQKTKDSRIIEELSICDGEVRVDIAVANGIMHGYEIKSDLDTLDRLPKQIKCYDTTFDKNTIIVGEKFLNKIDDIVPLHWGIELAYLNRFGNVSIKKIRSCHKNENVSSKKLLDLLWNNELKNLLKMNKIKGYSTMKREVLQNTIIENIPFKVIRSYTRETLKFREGWRTDLPSK